MRFLLRLTFIAVALFAAMSLLRGVLSPERSGQRTRTPAGGREHRGKLVKDPICGTYVPTQTALSTHMDSETFYFCSEECRSRFIAGDSA